MRQCKMFALFSLITFFSFQFTLCALEHSLVFDGAIHLSPNYGELDPKIAYNGTNFLVVFRDNGVHPRLYAQLLDQSANKIGDEFLIQPSVSENAFEFDICSNGDSFLVAWRGHKGIRGQIISGNGEVISQEIIIGENYSSQENPSISSEGINYMVAWKDYSHFALQKIDSTGKKLGGIIRPKDSLTGHGGDICYIFNKYFICWNGPNAYLYGQFIDLNGNSIGSEFIISNNGYDPEIASNSHNFVVTWSEAQPIDEAKGIYAQYFSHDGSMIGTQLHVNTYSLEDQINPSILSYGENYLISWETSLSFNRGFYNGIFGQIFDNDTNKIGSEFRINDESLQARYRIFCPPAGVSNGEIVFSVYPRNLIFEGGNQKNMISRI